MVVAQGIHFIYHYYYYELIILPSMINTESKLKTVTFYVWTLASPTDEMGLITETIFQPPGDFREALALSLCHSPC